MCHLILWILAYSRILWNKKHAKLNSFTLLNNRSFSSDKISFHILMSHSYQSWCNMMPQQYTWVKNMSENKNYASDQCPWFFSYYTLNLFYSTMIHIQGCTQFELYSFSTIFWLSLTMGLILALTHGFCQYFSW